MREVIVLERNPNSSRYGKKNEQNDHLLIEACNKESCPKEEHAWQISPWTTVGYSIRDHLYQFHFSVLSRVEEENREEPFGVNIRPVERKLEIQSARSVYVRSTQSSFNPFVICSSFVVSSFRVRNHWNNEIVFFLHALLQLYLQLIPHQFFHHHHSNGQQPIGVRYAIHIEGEKANPEY